MSEFKLNISTRCFQAGWTDDDCTMWFYKDKRGSVHGPYPEEQMAAWFLAGQLTMSLPVKRHCDADFQLLGDVIKACGRVPFRIKDSNHDGHRGIPGGTPTPARKSEGTPSTTPAAMGPPWQGEGTAGGQTASVSNEGSQSQVMWSGRCLRVTYNSSQPGSTHCLEARDEVYKTSVSMSCQTQQANQQAFADVASSSIRSQETATSCTKERSPKQPASHITDPARRQSRLTPSMSSGVLNPNPFLVPGRRSESIHQNSDSSPSTKSSPCSSGDGNYQVKDVLKLCERRCAANREFARWSQEALSAIPSYVHGPTFFEFLRDIESSEEVREYVRMHLGNSSDARKFADDFFERRTRWIRETGWRSLAAEEAPSPKSLKEQKGRKPENKK